MKTCNCCGVEKPFAKFYRARGCIGGVAGTCKDCRSSLNAEWTAANRDRINVTASRRRYEALCLYSDTVPPSCACCGESTSEFLTFEHIEGGGAKHRRQTGGGGFMSWLRAEKREGIEVLCMNCNHGRRVNNGVCPHLVMALNSR